MLAAKKESEEDEVVEVNSQLIKALRFSRRDLPSGKGTRFEVSHRAGTLRVTKNGEEIYLAAFPDPKVGEDCVFIKFFTPGTKVHVRESLAVANTQEAFRWTLQKNLWDDDLPGNGSGAWRNITGSFPIRRTGYFEVEVSRTQVPLEVFGFGVGLVAFATVSPQDLETCLGSGRSQSVGYYANTGLVQYSPNSTAEVYGPAFHDGDVLGVFYDYDSGHVAFAKNGEFLGVVRGFRFPPRTPVLPILSFSEHCVDTTINVRFRRTSFLFEESFGAIGRPLPLLTEDVGDMIHDYIQRVFDRSVLIYLVEMANVESRSTQDLPSLVSGAGGYELAAALRKLAPIIKKQLSAEESLTRDEQLMTDVVIRTAMFRLRRELWNALGDDLKAEMFSQNRGNALLDPLFVLHEEERKERKTLECALRVFNCYVSFLKALRIFRFSEPSSAMRHLEASTQSLEKELKALQMTDSLEAFGKKGVRMMTVGLLNEFKSLLVHVGYALNQATVNRELEESVFERENDIDWENVMEWENERRKENYNENAPSDPFGELKLF